MHHSWKNGLAHNTNTTTTTGKVRCWKMVGMYFSRKAAFWPCNDKDIPSLQTNSSHLKIGLPNRKVVFQPTIFRGELLVSGRVAHMLHANEISTYMNCLNLSYMWANIPMQQIRVVFVWKTVRLENVHPRNLSNFLI